jgi:general secretion pathway protein C
LPTTGVELVKRAKVKNLTSYSYRLAYKQKEIKRVVKKPKPTPKPVVKISMRGYRLTGIVSLGKMASIIVEKGGKSHVLALGEEIDKFKFVRVEGESAFFKKNGQEFKLTMGSKIENPAKAKQLRDFSKGFEKKRVEKRDNPDKNKFGIEKRDDITIIPKDLLSSYTKDVNKIWKAIGIGEHRTNGKLDGFVVNFVKKGSVFEHIGLKKGDILKSVNGEELDGYNSAFSIFRNINDIEDLTITILRNNKEMELEYEIH